jgi:hypothetical protein
MKTKEHFKEYDLLIGESSMDVFDYYEVDYMHGLSRSECEAYDDTNKDAYICGLANWSPNCEVGLKPFVFMNGKRFNGTHEDATSIMHEMMHMSLLIHGFGLGTLEEEIITWAEKETNKVIKLLRV